MAEGRAPRIIQWEGGATYDQLWQSKDLSKINWNQPALILHNFIRGNDKVGHMCILMGLIASPLYSI